MRRVPVIALTGHLGAGKTTLLNHVLRHARARIGVVVNDFGDINVDAALITGQVDQPASIAGGCLCCLVDDDRLDEALDILTRPQLAVDAVIVEASGVAEPGALANLIHYSGADRIRPGGVVDVVDALEYFATVDTGARPPARFAAASLIVLNKCDLLPGSERETTLSRVEQRIRCSNPTAPIVRTSTGSLDPALLFDSAGTTDPDDQLPFSALARAAHHDDRREHASASAVRSVGPVEPGRVVDLLENPPRGAYRIKGRVVVRSGRGLRGYVVNLVGTSIHVASVAVSAPDSELVAVGLGLEDAVARERLTYALEPTEMATAAGLRTLQRHRRLSA